MLTLLGLEMSSCVPKWKKRTADTSAEHKLELENREFEVLFLGDSMFQNFILTDDGKGSYSRYLGDHSIYNLGVCGDRIRNILWRLVDDSILNHVTCEPRQVIIMAGTNDVEYKKTDEMLDGYRQMIDIIRDRFPQTHIDVIGIYPRKCNKLSEAKTFELVSKFNDGLEEQLKGMSDITYHYYGDDVLDDSNGIIDKFFVDNVHFSSEGYDLFAIHLNELILANR